MMELKTPKARKKTSLAKLIMWGKMFKTPLLILFLLGTTHCDDQELTDDIPSNVPFSNLNITKSNSHEHRHKHGHSNHSGEAKVLSDIQYLKRHLNKQVNFVITDTLVDGEVENRVHYNGVTAKETRVGEEGNSLKLRQLTDGRHFVQLIYSQDGVIQDCEYITKGRQVKRFLRSLRKELKDALDENSYRISQNDPEVSEVSKFYRHFGNVTYRILRNGEPLPREVASWLNYDKLKMECLQRHEQLKYMAENMNKISETTLARSTRSLRENFILPGTKWCGAGQLASRYNELGDDRAEDTCCRSHDHCRLNIGAFKRRFGYFNFRPFTISHCRCDRRFRACLKLADTSVSNMVGKLFFNVLQTQCFILKPMKVCTKRSWWGKCLRKGYRKQAYMRNNLPY